MTFGLIGAAVPPYITARFNLSIAIFSPVLGAFDEVPLARESLDALPPIVGRCSESTIVLFFSRIFATLAKRGSLKLVTVAA